MIRDQLVEKTNSARIRERLLLEVPLDLKKAVTVARQIETATAEAKAMIASSDNSVQAVQQHNRFRRSKSKVNASRGPAKFTRACTCYRCGSEQHAANFPGCPAKDAVCRNCNKTGHFAKICRGNKRVSEITVPEVTVLNIEHSARDWGKIMCTVQICASTGQTQDIQLMVDTGSAVSILPMSIYTGSFSQAPLSPPKLSLVSFGGDAIEVKGCLSLQLKVKHLIWRSLLYHRLIQKGSAVLGRDLFTGLCLQICDGQVSTDQCTHPVSSIDAKSENWLGCARGFVHRVQVRPGSQPVQQKLRRLPFSIRNEVSKELQKLVQQDVIEPVDASEWVSPIVVTRKKMGGFGSAPTCVSLIGSGSGQFSSSAYGGDVCEPVWSNSVFHIRPPKCISPGNIA